MKALGFEIPTERLRMAGCGGFGDVMNTLKEMVQLGEGGRRDGETHQCQSRSDHLLSNV